MTLSDSLAIACAITQSRTFLGHFDRDVASSRLMPRDDMGMLRREDAARISSIREPRTPVSLAVKRNATVRLHPGFVGTSQPLGPDRDPHVIVPLLSHPQLTS